jgi:molybdopterin-guanine dinucleotide biosynthesis protein A
MTHTAPQNTTVTGVILCGGSGTRMGGTDKPLVRFRGAPMVEQVVKRLLPQVNQVVISANRNLHTYATLGRVITDSPMESRSPLTGVVRAFQEVTSEWLMVCPGDAPLLDTSLVARLQVAAPAQGAAFCHDGDRAQVLHVLLHRSLEPMLAAYLDGGHRSVEGWLNTLSRDRVVMVDCRDIATSFRNVNTADDLD